MSTSTASPASGSATAKEYDVRTFPARYPGDLLVRFARSLLGGVLAMDAVGGDAVVGNGPFGTKIVHIRHPDLIRALLIDNNDKVVKARGLRLARTLLGNGLLTSEVPHHTRQRKLILPAFHHQRLVSYGEVMVRQARAEADSWREGETIDLGAAMMRLTLAIAGETLFGANVLAEAEGVSEAVSEALAAFDRSQFLFAEYVTWLPLPPFRRARKARAYLDDLVYRLIAERRAVGTDGHDDLLSMLLDARDEETGEGMSDEEVRDEVMTLLLAGHETTALALAWTFAQIADEPSVLSNLHNEVDALSAEPTSADLPQLAYARQVFAESMRLKPPAWAIGRESAEAMTVGGFPIPRRSTITIAPLTTQRDPRFWPDPDRFDPDRFLPDQRSGRHKFAYFPFSAGRRGCIGEQFAWMEGTLVLAAIARDWTLALAAPLPDVHGSVTLRPATPILSTPHRRR